jgi:hypothetical protein
VHRAAAHRHDAAAADEEGRRRAVQPR